MHFVERACIWKRSKLYNLQFYQGLTLVPRESDNVVKWVSARSNAATMRYVTWGSQRRKKRRRWSERLVAWSGKRQEARGSRHETNEYQKGLASQGKTCRRRQYEVEGRKKKSVRKRGSDFATSNGPRMRPHPLPRGLSGDQESEHKRPSLSQSGFL